MLAQSSHRSLPGTTAREALVARRDAKRLHRHRLHGSLDSLSSHSGTHSGLLAGVALVTSQRKSARSRVLLRLAKIANEESAEGPEALAPDSRATLAQQSETESGIGTRPTWHAKLQRVCCTCDYDTIARVALSLGSDDAAAFVEAVAHECVTRHFSFFTETLRACRLRDVAPLVSVELYHLVEPWLREQCANHAAWEAVIYALTLKSFEANEYPDEAFNLLSEMESGADPRMPEPTSATYCILVQAVASSRGRMAARQLLSRSASFLIRSEPVIYLMLAAVHADADIDTAKTFVRKGEMLMRSWKGSKDVLHLGWSFVVSSLVGRFEGNPPRPLTCASLGLNPHSPVQCYKPASCLKHREAGRGSSGILGWSWTLHFPNWIGL